MKVSIFNHHCDCRRLILPGSRTVVALLPQAATSVDIATEEQLSDLRGLLQKKAPAAQMTIIETRAPVSEGAVASPTEDVPVESVVAPPKPETKTNTMTKKPTGKRKHKK